MRVGTKYLLLSIIVIVHVCAIAATQTIAEWTFLVYMQADNNLEPDALFNIAQMQNGIVTPISGTSPPDRSEQFTNRGPIQRPRWEFASIHAWHIDSIQAGSYLTLVGAVA